MALLSVRSTTFRERPACLPYAVNDSVSRGAQRVYERSHRVQASQRRSRPAVEQSKIARVPGAPAQVAALCCYASRLTNAENSEAKLLSGLAAKPDALGRRYYERVAKKSLSKMWLS